MSKQGVVIVSPDGGMQYCTEIENNNPYCKNKEKIVQTIEHQDEENMQRHRDLIQVDNNFILLTNIEVINARKLEKYNFTVRFICLFDIFTNIIYLLDIDLFTNIIFFIVSFFGYISTYTYNRSGFRIYLIYKYAISIYSISIVIFYNIKLLDDTSNIKLLSNSTFINNNIYTIYLNDMLYISVCIFQIFICFFLQYYYNLFPKYIMINNI
tara:strand:- start:993 stop:1625 length:633 start_codon:yes stop_codon:yes gene_type:complete